MLVKAFKIEETLGHSVQRSRKRVRLLWVKHCVRCSLRKEVKTLRSKRSNEEAKDVGEVVAETKEKRRQGERFRRWQLTENNPTYSKKEAVERLSRIGEAIYIVGCSEVGESGTCHIHAFVVFKNAIELDTLKRNFPRAHFEACSGTNQKNVEYIKKADKEPFEVGELPLAVSEEKSDISSEVVAIIIECGLSPFEILARYPRYSDYVVKNFRNLNEIHDYALHKRR